MYLIYVDESGVQGTYALNREFYVLSSVIIHEEDWRWFNSKINDIKRKHFPVGDISTIELKGAQIWNGTGPFSSFSTLQKEELLNDIFAIMCDEKFKVISVVVKKFDYPAKYGQRDMRHVAWEYLLERMEMFMTSTGSFSNSLIVMDSIGMKEDWHLHELIEAIKNQGTAYIQMDHILEVFFTNSAMKNITQLADIISYFTRQHMRTDINVDAFWNRIVPLLHTDRQGNHIGAGLKVIP